MDLAVAEWQRAEHLHADPEVERALAKARKGQSRRGKLPRRRNRSLRAEIQRHRHSRSRRGILHVLEDDFRDIESQLDYTPPEAIGVILYTDQAFADITRAPSWAGAINDGRIRIPVQGLSSVTSELARVLKHELTHSFIAQKSRGRAPTWLQEGVAQWMEGRRSNSAAGALVELAGQGRAPSLQMLEGSWMALSGGSASFAYAYSLAAVESIIQSGGMSDISRLLDRIATSPIHGSRPPRSPPLRLRRPRSANRRLPPPRISPLTRSSAAYREASALCCLHALFEISNSQI